VCQLHINIQQKRVNTDFLTGNIKLYGQKGNETNSHFTCIHRSLKNIFLHSWVGMKINALICFIHIFTTAMFQFIQTFMDCANAVKKICLPRYESTFKLQILDSTN
jgi:hypothetical protein